MLSERRKAQGGVIAAGALLVCTLTILYQGSRRAPFGPRQYGQPVVIGDQFPAERQVDRPFKLASTGK